MNNEIIVFDKVSLKISKTNILHNLNFSISQGDFTYLIGKTGSGKSSIIRSISVSYTHLTLPTKDSV